MSFPTHLIKVNNRFYFKIRVPVDLLQYFPCTFIKKSLKTDDPQSAKLLLVSMEYKIQQTFTLLRTGMLTDDVVKKLIGNLVPTKQKETVARGKLLSDVIEMYVAAKEFGWTAKSKMEFKCVFKLLVDILGDVEVATITKSMVMELRSTLLSAKASILWA